MYANNSVSHPVIWQCWKGSMRADTKAAPVAAPMPKRDAAKFWHKARELERRSRTPGRQDGRLGRNGLAVLHALIFDFLNHRTGQCDPSYEQIAAAAAISVRSVARGIKKLKAAGILDWARRCIADADASGRFVLRQISNAYEIIMRELVLETPRAPEPGTWGDHPSDGNALDRAAAAARDGLSGQAVIRQLEHEPGLGEALARLGRHFVKKI